MATNNQFVQATIESIIDFYDPEKIILFGAFYQGNLNKRSIVNLLLIKDTDLPKSQRPAAINEYLGETEFPLDILIYTTEEYYQGMSNPKSFLYNMTKQSRIMYEKQELVGRKV